MNRRILDLAPSSVLKNASSIPHRLWLLFVFLPNCLVDDCLGIIVGRLPATVVTGVHRNRDTAENVTFVCPLLKGDLLIAPDQAANLAKNAALEVIWRAHDPNNRSGTTLAASHDLSGLSVNYLTLGARQDMRYGGFAQEGDTSWAAASQALAP